MNTPQKLMGIALTALLSSSAQGFARFPSLKQINEHFQDVMTEMEDLFQQAFTHGNKSLVGGGPVVDMQESDEQLVISVSDIEATDKDGIDARFNDDRMTIKTPSARIEVALHSKDRFISVNVRFEAHEEQEEDEKKSRQTYVGSSTATHSVGRGISLENAEIEYDKTTKMLHIKMAKPQGKKLTVAFKD